MYSDLQLKTFVERSCWMLIKFITQGEAIGVIYIRAEDYEIMMMSIDGERSSDPGDDDLC